MKNNNQSEIKQREHNNWSAAAEGWRRRDALLTTGAAPVSMRMLELVNIKKASRLLDIASGTGEPSISAAKIVGESGEVVGTDLVEEMLIVAREKAEKQNVKNINFHCIDAEKLNIEAASFDAVTIRWGLMFMPDPLACLNNANKALKSGGRISLACWTGIDQNPFVGVLLKTLSQYMELPVPPAGTPGIFAFSDKKRLHDVIKLAGFKNIVIEEMLINVIEVKDGAEYWAAMSDLAAPVMALVKQLDDSARKHYIKDVIAEANKLKQGNSLPMKGTTWIASADKI